MSDPLFFINPNALSFNIKLPAKESAKPKVPPGIRSPNTFLEVGKYHLHLLVIEIENGSDTFLSQWKDKPAAFAKAYQSQFTAYAQGMFPFNLPLGAGQPPLEWWQSFEATPDGGILAAITIKLYSAVPHSMADERTMSFVTMLNSARRSRQKVETIIAMAQVRGYYQAENGVKVCLIFFSCYVTNPVFLQHRRSSRPRPTVRFFDVKRLLRSIDEDERDDDPNYDKSDDEDDVPSFRTTTASPSAPLILSESSTSLPGEGDTSELDFTSPIVIEILGDGPVVKKGKPSMASKASVVDEEIGGTFELQEWV
ncbi:hypothetical protein CPB83DRAFT_770862 [Crepidotus variabilis]|uniref:Uncharacterized protein n=1 Tax=Crepidotus variabilis TaxID=179855 RepID=A0A9P6EB70_9AGAR|nr:hypothetical protein CPB83DRAFT_770862 [Crepidotus variabilis]